MTARKPRTHEIPGPEDLVSQVLGRIAEILLKHGLDSPNAERMLRRAFVAAALARLRATNSRPTQSQIASIAGISRLDVRALMAGSKQGLQHHSTRVDQVISGWTTDSVFLDGRGKPRVLQTKGRIGSFEHLARKYGRDVTPRALRSELARRGMVKIEKDKICLRQANKRISRDSFSALADLKFVSAQLAEFNLPMARRSHVIRKGVVVARDKKDMHVIRHLAIERIEAVLSSLAQISLDRGTKPKSISSRQRRIVVSATVSTESEEEEV